MTIANVTRSVAVAVQSEGPNGPSYIQRVTQSSKRS